MSTWPTKTVLLLLYPPFTMFISTACAPDSGRAYDKPALTLHRLSITLGLRLWPSSSFPTSSSSFFHFDLCFSSPAHYAIYYAQSLEIRLTGNVKEKIARRNCERDSKNNIDGQSPIASALDHYYGRLDNPFDVADKDEGDASSVSSFSTMATTDDNCGAGWTVDKYFYQPVGRKIEKNAFQIAMPLLSPGIFFFSISRSNVVQESSSSIFVEPEV